MEVWLDCGKSVVTTRPSHADRQKSGDPGWVRTSNLVLRRDARYPIVPRGHLSKDTGRR
ncbi:hypothetical protein XFF6990_30013 [Xanthomonas citri pv. fuscans]|nr:hypothetical protein XFF6990_30013 [Xanthomonas citri pv. fuscans]